MQAIQEAIALIAKYNHVEKRMTLNGFLAYYTELSTQEGSAATIRAHLTSVSILANIKRLKSLDPPATMNSFVPLAQEASFSAHTLKARL